MEYLTSLLVKSHSSISLVFCEFGGGEERGDEEFQE